LLASTLPISTTLSLSFSSLHPPAPISTPFPYTTLVRSHITVFCRNGAQFIHGRLADLPRQVAHIDLPALPPAGQDGLVGLPQALDRKSTRLNSSHVSISYAVFCLKKKKSHHHRSYNCS